MIFYRVDFTSDGMPVAVAAGNLWFVCSIGCTISVANRTSHKFPTATPTGVPSEVKSTVYKIKSTFGLIVLCWEVCPISECPLSEVSLYCVVPELWS